MCSRDPFDGRLRPARRAAHAHWSSIASAAIVVCGVLFVAGPPAARAAVPVARASVTMLAQAHIQAGADVRVVAPAGDVNGDGRPDLIVATGNASDGAEFASVYVVFGSADRTTVDLGDLGTRGFRIDGIAGSAVAAAGDVNGDGRGDVIVGAPLAHAVPVGAGASVFGGAAYVVFGKKDGATVDLSALGTGGFQIANQSTFEAGEVGSSVAAIGDVNGDGLADVVVGATLDQAAYVVFGKSDGATVDLSALGSGGYAITGTEGQAVSVAGAGDVNGDGRPDVIVGDETARDGDGAAYVVFGKTDNATVNLRELGTHGFRIDGPPPGFGPTLAAGEAAGAGGEVLRAGDVNGDGLADVMLTTAAYTSDGKPDPTRNAYVVFGKMTSTTVRLGALGREGFRIDGVEGAGTLAVDGAEGDVNGDGRADLVFSAPHGIFVVPGKASHATVNLAEPRSDAYRLAVPGSVDLTIPEGHAGIAVAGAGDVDGDGRPDLVESGSRMPFAYGVYAFAAPRYPRLDSKIAYAYRHDGARTTITHLAVRHSHAGSSVLVGCAGRGCPFESRTIVVKRAARRLDLSRLLRDAKLSPGTRLEVRVTEPGAIGRSQAITIHAGHRPPTVARACLSPTSANGSTAALVGC